MKSLLSENMLRFGTKNLTATSKQELIVKSIMETIDQHGLRKTIYNRLVEQTGAEIGAIDKKLGADVKTQGIGQKIVGKLMVALGGADDEEGVLEALQMIPKYGGKKIYDSVIWSLQNSRNVKSKYGKNFNLVADMIKEGGISNPGHDSTQSADVHNPLRHLGAGWTDEEWTPKYEAILQRYNDKETF